MFYFTLYESTCCITDGTSFAYKTYALLSVNKQLERVLYIIVKELKLIRILLLHRKALKSQKLMMFQRCIKAASSGSPVLLLDHWVSLPLVLDKSNFVSVLLKM